MQNHKAALAVHGGAGEIPRPLLEQYRGGIREALTAGWGTLSQGGTALDACQRAVVRLEDLLVFNAGVGARLNRDGEVELDAAVMDGRQLAAGAVAAVKRIKNPVSLSRLVMERSEHVFLVAGGAEDFARAQGISLCEPSELVAPRERSRWLDWRRGLRQRSVWGGTVGAVAVDGNGDVAAATSTGGVLGKQPGRVGDSPILGCGCYADNRVGAVSATGDGEAILKVGLSRTALNLVASGIHPQSAVEGALEQMRARTSGLGGLIVVDSKGRHGIAHTTLHMSAGFMDSDAMHFQVQTESPRDE